MVGMSVYITSAFWEPTAFGELKQRRYSSLRGAVPDWLPGQERHAPRGFQCLSPFALPRFPRGLVSFSSPVPVPAAPASFFGLPLRDIPLPL